MKKILIVCPNWLGDSILYSKVINFYRLNYPDAKIVIYANKTILELYKFLPEPKKLVVFNKKGKIIYWLKFYLENFRVKWFRIVNFRVSHIARLLRGRLITRPMSAFNKHDNKHLLELLDGMLDLDDASDTNYKPKLWMSPSLKRAKNIPKDMVIINPNGAWYGKIWPASNFFQLLNKIIENPIYDNLKFGIIGRSSDKVAIHIYELLKKNNLTDRVDSYIDKFDILETQELISRAKLVISNDTAIMHMAAILNKPLIALFGPTNYNGFKPVNFKNNPLITSLGEQEDFRKFRTKVGYSNKRRNVENYMSHISIDQVYNTFAMLIKKIDNYNLN